MALPLDTAFFSLFSGSYKRLLGKELVPKSWNDAEAAGWLYHDAPFAVLAQDSADDPAFVYANMAAQQLFAYSWREFVGLPSRLSAPLAGRGARDRLMAGVRSQGYAEGYRGLRESGTGRRFWIEDVTIWNLTAADGAVCGQAALIRSWSNA
ncbi:MEKHLA domain-containing protein [Streptomyces sp. NPDC048663]|uniref:MEKHLA domain-containing protein n=1 Tax=Streptomyces sp. NPDC048663 TaxID=3155638 RepID=UPI00343FA4EC